MGFRTIIRLGYCLLDLVITMIGKPRPPISFHILQDKWSMIIDEDPRYLIQSISRQNTVLLVVLYFNV